MIWKSAQLAVLLGVAFNIGPANATGVMFKDCRSTSLINTKTTQRLIGSNWTIYRPFLKSCPVISPNGQIPFFITALSLPAANAAGKLFASNGKIWHSQTAQQTYDSIPLPIIFSRHGRVLGRLPADLLPMPPQQTTITFDRWRHDWPRHIVIRETDPTASPPLSPCGAKALVWDSKLHRFINDAGFCKNSTEVLPAANKDKKHGT